LKTSLLWRVVGLSALVSTVLLVVGLIYAVNDIMNPKAASFTAIPDKRPNNGLAQDDGKLDIVAIGDSLTKGTGDETGKGYIGYLKDKLAETTGNEVHVLNNLAVNGYRTDQLLLDLTKASVADSLGRADIIVFTIGGNDLFRYVREELDITSAEISGEDLRKSIPEPSLRLEEILKRLQEINSRAVIVYVGLFNPFLDLDPSRETSVAIAEWNAKAAAYAHAYPNVVLVPTADLFERNLLEYLYSDHFHPNTAGYERIAERIAQALQ